MIAIYNAKGALYKGTLLRTSVIINLLMTIVIAFIISDIYSLIVYFTELYITVLPSLLGFNLGAYALLIGLASSDVLHKMTNIFEKTYSSFQRASSVFGFCVLIQALALIFAFLIKSCLLIGAESSIQLIHLSESFIWWLNLTVIFFLNALGVYSILILISVIRNIFTLSQAAHLFAVTKTIQKIRNQKDPE